MVSIYVLKQYTLYMIIPAKMSLHIRKGEVSFIPCKIYETNSLWFDSFIGNHGTCNSLEAQF